MALSYLPCRQPRRPTAGAVSSFGTFRTWRHVRLESAARTKADVRRPLQGLWVHALVSIDPDDPALFDGERQLAVLERECGFAEHLAAPAAQRADVGIVVSGDLFEIVDRRD